MTINTQGQLILNKSGALVLDNGNRPISMPANAKTISIGLDGQIKADGRGVAMLGLAGFRRPTTR